MCRSLTNGTLWLIVYITSAKYYLLRAFPEIFKQLSLIVKNILRLEATHVTGSYMCFVVTCWDKADLLALVCGV